MANVRTFFSDDLPSKIAERPELAQEIDAVIQFNVDWSAAGGEVEHDRTDGARVRHCAPEQEAEERPAEGPSLGALPASEELLADHGASLAA